MKNKVLFFGCKLGVIWFMWLVENKHQSWFEDLGERGRQERELF